MSLLCVDELTVSYGSDTIVDRVSFAIDRGEAVGLVGASGSGKTQTALALLGLLPASAKVGGRVELGGVELVTAAPDVMRRQRGRRIAMVFQDPLLALNPYLTVGAQLSEILLAHDLATRKAASAEVAAALGRVGLPDPERQARRYPHELSGGMRQRVMIAAALLAEPELLVADEPTTALDVTVQASVLDMLDELRGETALLLITHDLGIVAGHCERMLVLDGGRLVESGYTAGVFREPADTRTRALLDEALWFDRAAPAPTDGELLLCADGLTVTYPAPRREELTAVRDLDLALRAGETLAVVGESGSGKSSMARAILGLVSPQRGRVVFAGESIPPGLGERGLGLRRDLQMVFQDPVGSLSPAMTVQEIVGEPLAVHEPALDATLVAGRVAAAVAAMGLDASLLDARPHELSGGQAQRVAIARAIILNPRVLVCDEAVAALDGGVRRRILDALADVQRDTGLSIIFISHDLAVVQSIAHRVAVMYLGRVVEVGPTGAVFSEPRHPYTRALIDAVPLPDPHAPGGLATLDGEIPSPLAPPPGCSFATRCAWVGPECHAALPVLERREGVRVACIRAAELDLRARGSSAGPR
jgi:oligopeptide/dipeptide ABC transporter ATP-binding protein